MKPSFSHGPRACKKSRRPATGYLHVEKTTAQRWERHNRLPGHRLPGKRGGVNARAQELDAWRLVNEQEHAAAALAAGMAAADAPGDNSAGRSLGSREKDNLSRQGAKAQSRKEEPIANPHRFRHTFASDMVRAGVSLPALVQSMGHAQIQTTLVYMQVTPPEVDMRPPAYRVQEIFRIGTRRGAYSKPRDAAKILQGKDLAVAAGQCPEPKAFPNTILTLSGAEPL